MAEAQTALALASPETFPIALYADGVDLIRLTEADYLDAAFLDERLLTRPRPRRRLERAEAEAAAEALPAACDFLFHTGYVGSTLLSRLLGDHPAIFSLREPAVLRALALQDPPAAADLGLAVRLLSRTWRPEQRALIKATSFVSEIGPELLAAVPSARAIALFVSPLSYIPNLLAGDGFETALRPMAPRQIARIARRVGAAPWRAEALSPGELAALTWTCEIVCLADLVAGAGGRVRWLDFEAVLAKPAHALAACLDHLERRGDPEALPNLLASRHWSRHAKAADHAFGAADRTARIEEAGRRHAGEIERGIAWLNAAGRTYPAIAEATRAAAAGRAL